MKMTATTHIPRQSANNHLFRRALFCSFGVRNIIFVVIFFPFHHTTLSLDSNRASHPRILLHMAVFQRFHPGQQGARALPEDDGHAVVR